MTKLHLRAKILPMLGNANTLLLVFCLAFSSLTYAEEEKKEVPPTPPPPIPSIKGKATVQLKIKKKPDPLGKIEVALCPPTAAPKIKAARDTGWLRLAHPKRYNDGYSNLDLKSIGIAAVKTAIDRVKADAQGNYAFYNVEPGEYLLYAQYKSRYASGYWLLPVTVTEENQEPIIQDLHTKNYKEIYNRQIR